MYNNSKAESCDFCCFQVFVVLVLLSAGIYFWATKIRLDDSHLLVTGKRPNSVSTIGEDNCIFSEFPTYVANRSDLFQDYRHRLNPGSTLSRQWMCDTIKGKTFLGLKERSEKQNVQHDGNCMLLFRTPKKNRIHHETNAYSCHMQVPLFFKTDFAGLTSYSL